MCQPEEELNPLDAIAEENTDPVTPLDPDFAETAGNMESVLVEFGEITCGPVEDDGNTMAIWSEGDPLEDRPKVTVKACVGHVKSPQERSPRSTRMRAMSSRRRPDPRPAKSRESRWVCR